MATVIGKTLLSYHSTARTIFANGIKFRYRITSTATQCKTNSTAIGYRFINLSCEEIDILF